MNKINRRKFLKRQMSEIRDGSKWRRCHGEKAKRPRRFWDGAGKGVVVRFKGRFQAGPLPSVGFRSRRRPHSHLEKMGAGWRGLLGSAKGARGPKRRPHHGAGGSARRSKAEESAPTSPRPTAARPSPTARAQTLTVLFR